MTLDIRISHEAVPQPKHAVTIELHLMHGDADGFSGLTLGPYDYRSPKGEAELIQALQMLQLIDPIADPEDYLTVEEFEPYDNIWPRDATCADTDWGNRPTLLKSYKTFYFDANGVKYPCQVNL